MKTRKRFFNFNSQHGGMLLELMLSLAIAAIIIPFVFRYQKNTVERARNVAIAKQIEIVQHAMERCINFHQDEFFLHVGAFIFAEPKYHCLSLEELVAFGLDENFAKDFKDSYVMRVLKSADNNGQATLQGVVLLADTTNLTALRTREIVNIGGGQLGFVENDNVLGGYNSFDTDKQNFGLDTYESGLVKTTEIMRGNTKYIWRVPDETGNNINATMNTWLNLGYQDIENVKKMGASVGSFIEVNSKKASSNIPEYTINVNGTTTFYDRAYFGNGFSLTGNSIKVGSESSPANMYVTGALDISNISAGTTTFSSLTTANLTKTGDSNTLFLTSSTGKISGTNFKSGGGMQACSFTADKVITSNVETSGLSIKKLLKTENEKYYWNTTDRSIVDDSGTYYMGAHFQGIRLTDFAIAIANLRAAFNAEEAKLCKGRDSLGYCNHYPGSNRTLCTGTTNCGEAWVSSVQKMEHYLATNPDNTGDIIELLRVLHDIKDRIHQRFNELEAAHRDGGTSGSGGSGSGTGSGGSGDDNSGSGTWGNSGGSGGTSGSSGMGESEKDKENDKTGSGNSNSGSDDKETGGSTGRN